MNMWAAIVIIVAIVLGADTIQKVSRNRSRKKTDAADLADTLKRIDEFEERVKVLERIVTESKFDLRHEINKL